MMRVIRRMHNDVKRRRLSRLICAATLLTAGNALGAAYVSLTSAEAPTTVFASTIYSTDSANSTDTLPFDRTVRSGGSDAIWGTSVGTTARLSLQVTAQEIRSSLAADVRATANAFGSTAQSSQGADFSLDLVVDAPTPFFFEASTSVTGSAFNFNNVGYRLYTPSSNDLDVAFGSQEGRARGGSASGILIPGVTYRLEFTARSSALARQYPPNYGPGFSQAVTDASAVLIIPEANCLAILSAGVTVFLRRTRR